ncbi:unnamed protein product [Spirodela intermedia]|uniref:Uncharacterized protein n=1 Tax=Spirodela intermedia TaxID=51605 RepID=A0A7I8LLJ7_SPIIN|nr:unnamed protein product [Spirodela intermedia]
MESTVTALCADYQSSLYEDGTEIRKTLGVMKNIAVDLERDKMSVEGVLELLNASDDCAHFSSAVKSTGDAYVPGTQVIAAPCIVLSLVVAHNEC